jgi:hypothetical protein
MKGDDFNIRRPLLVRSTNIKCNAENCIYYVSIISHTFCYYCAFYKKDTEEYKYHVEKTYKKCTNCCLLKLYDPYPQCVDCDKDTKE